MLLAGDAMVLDKSGGDELGAPEMFWRSHEAYEAYLQLVHGDLLVEELHAKSLYRGG